VRDNCLKNHFNDTENIFVYKKKEAPKKRIGFISDFLTRNHSVFKDRHQVIKYLSDKEDFEVYLITFNNIMIGKENIYKNTKKIVLGNNSLYNYIKTIRDLNLDKLVFCEIGMDGKVTNLAHFRMANKQYNTWGHSDTSGYKEIDYFVSSKLYELPYEESSKHYTEKLILQNGMCTCYVNPTKKYNLMNTRSFYGLSNYEKIILCPQSLFKIHPDFDLYIFEILFKNPNASIVLLHNERKNKMYERWDKVLKIHPKYFGVLSRVKFVLGQSHQNFCNLMKCADVLIDPYPFGGCNSSLESFSLFKPLVTQPSIRINGRFTYGFYKKMDMDEMISNNMEEYVDITTRLLNDKDFYDNQVNLLKERSDILFEDQETLKEWEELMSE
jgi:protein O-GlcNAc transferase